jgi:hypothetical protein
MGTKVDRVSLQPVIDFYTDIRKAARSYEVLDAGAFLSRGLALGLATADLLVGLIQPALAEIGHLYQAGQVSLVAENRFSKFCESVLDLIHARTWPFGPANRVDVLLVYGGGNYHTLGLRMLELLLRDRGMVINVLCPGLPHQDVLDVLVRDRPRVFGVSAACKDQLADAIELLVSAGRLPAEVRPRKLLLGGPAIKAATPALVIPPEIYRSPAHVDELVELILS